MSQPFVLGVNYWPRRKAMGWWSDFDIYEVREDFALIKEYGMNLVRIFLLWEDFQISPDSVVYGSLQNLEAVCDAAQENALRLDITFFTGHMSGPNWAPRWALQGKALAGARKLVSEGRIVDSSFRNPFFDPVMIQAAKKLVFETVSCLKDHPAVGFWNLGNEPDLFALPYDGRSALSWVRGITETIRSIDSVHPVLCGLHAASLSEVNAFRCDEIFDVTDYAVMHSYPMYSDIARNSLDSDFVPFTCALTSALCGKPVLMEEFGGCTAPRGEKSCVWEWKMYGEPHSQFMASEDDFAEYTGEVLPKLVKNGTLGALLWCFADYAESIWNKPPCDEVRHERHFGLVRPDGTLKPHAEVIKKFAMTYPLVNKNAQRFSIGMTAREYYEEPAKNMRLLYGKYLSSKV